MILTTTPSVEGKTIKKHLGIVTGTDIYLVGGLLGGGLVNQEKLFGEAYEKACDKMISKAPNADAIVNVQVQISSPGGVNYIIVLVTGTAVKLENINASNINENNINSSVQDDDTKSNFIKDDLLEEKRKEYGKILAKAEKFKDTFYDRDYRIRIYETIVRDIEVFADENFDDSVEKLQEYSTHLQLLKRKAIK